MELLGCAQDEIGQLILPGEVPLQIQRAQLGDVELEVPPLAALEVRVDPAHAELVHRLAVTRIQFDQTGNRVDVLVRHLRGLAHIRQPLCERAHEVGLLRVHFLVTAAETATEQVVGDATQAPAAL